MLQSYMLQMHVSSPKYYVILFWNEIRRDEMVLCITVHCLQRTTICVVLWVPFLGLSFHSFDDLLNQRLNQYGF